METFEIILLMPERRLYGLKLKNTLYFATLVELPCIIEAMKTLDYFNYFKSQDASQLLYVHSVDEAKIDNFVQVERENPQLIKEKANNFWAVKHDPKFKDQLYKRGEAERNLKKAEEAGRNDYPTLLKDVPESMGGYDDDGIKLQFRSGISPAAFNVKNIRHKSKPDFRFSDVEKVEGTLNQIIQYGFASNVEEELLEFDSAGNLINVTSGGRAAPQDITGTSMHESKSREPSAMSASAMDSSDGESSMFTKSAHKVYDGLAMGSVA